jgi:adenine-specific DNA-methyltransferase
LLDAGAGIGALSAAFLERWLSKGFGFERVRIDAFEIDETLHCHLKQTLDEYCRRLDVVPVVRGGDFVEAAVGSLSGDMFADTVPRYTHAILNPPYKKIRSDSAFRTALRRIGIETVNLYSAFVALSLSLLEEGGQLVAIVPRSFCNGPYYRPFRDFLFRHASLRHMHLFQSRDRAFRDDGVLQENIIILLERAAQHQDVTVSSSTDGSFTDYSSHVHPFGSIVLSDDPERFIHVPTSHNVAPVELAPTVRFALDDLGIEVSTGPVVDFRMRKSIRNMPEANTVPLLYPGHFADGKLEWPKSDFRKPNAIVRDSDTEKWLFPMGSYAVVRRFSSKEERRRIVASVVDPTAFPGITAIGFENHLNVFHCGKHGLPKDLARGLAVFLNASSTDAIFRCFNGHTQVNATDLRRIKYPSWEALVRLGVWAASHAPLDQSMIDARMEDLAV